MMLITAIHLAMRESKRVIRVIDKLVLGLPVSGHMHPPPVNRIYFFKRVHPLVLVIPKPFVKVHLSPSFKF
jgi:hypothetical protein